ncbi:MAG: hypothetical protein O7I42_21155, partial [Alphaproteobacteria bacterium]|nr:hypothetical protein [Alphaproteobacteria bacterium]
VLGIAFLLFFVVAAGPLNPMSAFLYAAMAVMAFLLWQRDVQKAVVGTASQFRHPWVGVATVES